jgi:hypothetical protein
MGGHLKLFSLSGAVGAEPDVPGVSTPLGPVLLSASAGDEWASSSRCASFTAAGDASLHAWESPSLRAELLVVRPRLTLPAGLAVIDCRAAAWRVRSRARIPALSFRAGWPSDVSLADLGAENGEHLEARSWSRGDMKVTIGTRDGDALLTDARVGRLPARWSSAGALGCEDHECLDLVRNSAGGLEVPLPPLGADEDVPDPVRGGVGTVAG